jgi:xanthine dehydrogenase molybdopterin-binding subunit B
MSRKNAAAVELGRLGGRVGGKSTSPAKLAACRRTILLAQKARRQKYLARVKRGG